MSYLFIIIKYKIQSFKLIIIFIFYPLWVTGINKLMKRLMLLLWDFSVLQMCQIRFFEATSENWETSLSLDDVKENLQIAIFLLKI